MTPLTTEQIYARARAAGLGVGAATIATAIALAESSGRADAQGDVGIQTDTWGPSVGLWQVRSLKAEQGTGRTRDAAKLADPAQNAKSMVEISRGGKSWAPWTAYTSGAYLRHTRAAEAAARKVEGGGGGGWQMFVDPLDIVPGIGRDGGVRDELGDAAARLNPVAGVAEAIRGGVGDLVTGGSRLMLTGLLVLGGVTLVAAGLIRGVAPVAQKNQQQAAELVGTAAAVTPQGRAAGAAGKGAA